LAKKLEKHFTYVADGAGGERTMWQKSGVQPAVTGKQQPLGSIHGKLKTLVEKGYDKRALRIIYSDYW
jgi:hypothetical protein